MNAMSMPGRDAWLVTPPDGWSEAAIQAACRAIKDDDAAFDKLMAPIIKRECNHDDGRANDLLMTLIEASTELTKQAGWRAKSGPMGTLARESARLASAYTDALRDAAIQKLETRT